MEWGDRAEGLEGKVVWEAEVEWEAKGEEVAKEGGVKRQAILMKVAVKELPETRREILEPEIGCIPMLGMERIEGVHVLSRQLLTGLIDTMRDLNYRGDSSQQAERGGGK